MSLNNISLSSHLVADLYQHTLVGDTASAVPQPARVSPPPGMPAATNATPANPPVTFLGKNGKNILIVVNKPDVPYLSDSELDFLTKILTACQLGLGDVAIVNWSRLANPDASALATELGAKDVILFDTPPSLFGLSPATPMFTVMNLAGRRFTAAPALTEIENSREAKQQLWMALKQLFSV